MLELETLQNSIFKGLSINDMEEIYKKRISNYYKRGTTLFVQGNPCYGLFIMIEGKAKISRTTKDGNETIVKIINSGELIGHKSILNSSKYNVTAYTIEDSSICFFDKNFLLECAKSNPRIIENLYSYISDEVTSLENRVHSLASKNVRERLAELLVYLGDNFSGNENKTDEIRLDLQLSRDEMASIIGVASETLIRLMSDFRSEGIIQKKGRTIFLKDRSKLAEYAN